MKPLFQRLKAHFDGVDMWQVTYSDLKQPLTEALVAALLPLQKVYHQEAPVSLRPQATLWSAVALSPISVEEFVEASEALSFGG